MFCHKFIRAQYEMGNTDTFCSSTLPEVEVPLEKCNLSKCYPNDHLDKGKQSNGLCKWINTQLNDLYKRKHPMWYMPLNNFASNSNESCRNMNEITHEKMSDVSFENVIDLNCNSTIENDETTPTKTIATKETRTRSCSPYRKCVIKPPKQRAPCSRNEELSFKKSDSAKSDPDNLPKSVISIKERSGTLYRLEFYTENPQFTPLYVDFRHTPQAANEKKVQPRASLHGETNIYANRKHAPTRVYKEDLYTNQRNKNIPERTGNIGSIYFSYNGILFKAKCTSMIIKQIKQPVDPDITTKIERMGMPSSESRKNKGIVVCRCGYDMFQLKFHMTNITCRRVEVRGIAAVQTEDKLVYVREKSPITNRTTLITLPESTYFYTDPMKTLHRMHLSFQGTDIMPLWKYELMKSRIAENRGSGKLEADLNRAYKQTRGTRLLFEGLDALVSTEDGLLCCDIAAGVDKYESMMLDEYEHRGGLRKVALVEVSQRKPASKKSPKERVNSTLDADEQPEEIQQDGEE